MLEERLRGIPFLRDVPAVALSAIGELLVPVRIAAGAVLFAAGETADALYLVGQGWLQVLDPTTGRELAMMGPGSVLGEVGVLLGSARSATVRASSDAELWRLSRDDAGRIVESHPTVGVALSREMGKHLLHDRSRAEGPPRVVVVPAPGTVELAGAIAASGARAALLDLAGGVGALPPGVVPFDRMVRSPEDVVRLASEAIDEVDVVLVALPADERELASAAASVADHGVAVGGALPPWAAARIAATRRVKAPTSPAALARAGRWVAGRSVGLALSSGGSKTVAHIGVLKVLREAGITIDAVSGTSGGSITAACLAFGADQATIVHRLGELPSAFRLRRLMPRIPPRQSLFRGANVLPVFERWFGAADLSDSQIPLFVVTADVATGEEVVLRRGPVALAVRASMGIPAVFPPVRWDDRWLTDGGIVTPLPTGPLRDAGIATVIASNVAGQDPTVRSTPNRAPRLVETVGRIVSAMEREVLGPEVALADVQVRPVVRAANSFDFRRVDDYLAEGERAAREALPAIHAAIET